MEEVGGIRLVPRVCGIMGELGRVRHLWRPEKEEETGLVWKYCR